ncbi:MAG: siderophore-interacting protein, partial [Actinomycetota bacterium]
MSILRTIRQNTKKNQATVVATERVGDGLRSIVVEPRHEVLGWSAGQAVAVVVDPEGAGLKDRWRHYTVRRLDPATGTLELLVVERDDPAPAARWIAGLDVGSTFTFMGPGGSPVVETGAASYLFVGDRTSLASIAAMVETIEAEPGPNPSAIEVLVATPNPERADLTTGTSGTVRWVEADTAAEIRERLVDALPDEPPPDTRAYVTGEMEMMRAVRTELGHRGFARRR